MISFIEDEPLVSFLIAMVVAVTLFVVFVIVKESRDCSARGGEMVGTGQYTTTYVLSGKVMVPITTENQVCTVSEVVR